MLTTQRPSERHRRLSVLLRILAAASVHMIVFNPIGVALVIWVVAACEYDKAWKVLPPVFSSFSLTTWMMWDYLWPPPSYVPDCRLPRKSRSLVALLFTFTLGVLFFATAAYDLYIVDLLAAVLGIRLLTKTARTNWWSASSVDVRW